jgi:hypothetical protein
MKSFLLLMAFITSLLLSGCSFNEDYSSYEYNPSFYDPCLENEWEILNRPGSPDAPILYIGIGIESGIISLSWTEIPEADYYILEESDCPTFLSSVYRYINYDNHFTLSPRYPWYYRVRTVNGGSSTGWSNVIKNTF